MEALRSRGSANGTGGSAAEVAAVTRQRDEAVKVRSVCCWYMERAVESGEMDCRPSDKGKRG